MSSISGDNSIDSESLSQIEGLAIGVITLIYVFINDVTTKIALPITLTTQKIDLGIVIIATSAIIFGKKVAGVSGGLGPLAMELQSYLATGFTNATVSFGILLTSSAIGIGAWFLGLFASDYHYEQIRGATKVFSKKVLAVITRSSLASIVGLALIKNFIFVFGAQFQEGAPLSQGIPFFLMFFITDTILILVFVPLVIFSYLALELFNKKRDQIMDLLMRDLEVNISEVGKAEVVSVEIVDHAITQGVWSPVKVKFKNIHDSSVIFKIEAISNAKITPTVDRTRLLEPEEIWTQMFYILPTKQKKVTVRIKISPEKEIKYKEQETDNTILEFETLTKNPSNAIRMLAGFSGINVGAIGVSALWKRALDILVHPQDIINFVIDNSVFFVKALFVEASILVTFLGGTYWFEKRKREKSKALKLSFSSDLSQQKVLNKTEQKIREMIRRYNTKIDVVLKVLLSLTTILMGAVYIYQTYQLFLSPTQNNLEMNLNGLFWATVGIIGVMVFGLKGTDIIRQYGGISDDEAKGYSKKDVVIEFKPMNPILEDETTIVLVKIRNPTSLPGIRIAFEGLDTVSPAMLELHIDSQEIAEVKISITPQEPGNRQLMVLAYPLFDSQQRYIPADIAEPFLEQIIRYDVTKKTFGLNKEQKETISRLGIIATAVFAVYMLVSQFLPLPEITNISSLQNQIFLGFQAPILYAYYFINNRIKAMEAL